MTHEDVRKMIDTDPDFIYMKRFDFSLEKFLDRYPEGAPVRVIAQALMMTEEEVEEIYERIVVQLRQAMNVDV